MDALWCENVLKPHTPVTAPATNEDESVTDYPTIANMLTSTAANTTER